MRVALAVVLLVSLGSSAAEHLWRALGESADGCVVYIDLSSVKHETRKDAHMASAWFKGRKPKSKHNTWVELEIFNCIARSSGTLSYIKYDSRGHVTKSEDTQGLPVLTPVAPETIAEAMIDSVCVDIDVDPAPARTPEARTPDKYP